MAAHTLLVVDDSSTIRMQVRIMLKALALEILDAENGQVALDFIGARSIDLVLTDINMPVLDGFGLIQQTRASERGERIPIVVMTSREADADFDHAFELGANSYVSKPLVKDELITVIRRHLQIS